MLAAFLAGLFVFCIGSVPFALVVGFGFGYRKAIRSVARAHLRGLCAFSHSKAAGDAAARRAEFTETAR